MRKLFIILAAAALCMVACKKDENGGNGSADGNYWYIHNNAQKGIKTVVQDNVTYNFDKDGKLISQKTQYDEYSYTYNSDGFVAREDYKSLEDGVVSYTSSTSYEYGNKGKWTPVPMGPGNVFHIFMQGLYNGISKVTFDGGDVMTYKFSGSKLTISTSSSGPQPYDDIVFEYNGAYPVHYKKDGDGFGEEIGPLTYQANGMFDTYRECFLNDGILYMERIYTINRNFKSVMLSDTQVSKSWNLNYDPESGKAVSQAELYNTETITSTYNEHGDLVRETTINTSTLSEDYLTTCEYEYDSKGNWTKCTTTMTVTRPAGIREPNVYVQNRTIEYY